MPRSESEPVSITVKRPSRSELKRIYRAVSDKPQVWLTFWWETPSKTSSFDWVNPYKEVRGYARSGPKLFGTLLEEEGDDKPIYATVVVQENHKDNRAPIANRSMGQP